MEEIRALVATNDKQRFTLKPNPAATDDDDDDNDPAHWLIRANQGHSIRLASAALLTPIADATAVPPVVVHGTYFAFWPAIEAAGGLRPMARTHVHCATGVPDSGRAGAAAAASASAADGEGEGGDEPTGATAVKSGMRRDAELLVYLDVRRSLDDGALQWWVSDNGVVLTEGDADGLVPARYFKEVVGRFADVGTLWKDGVKVGDLPPGLKGRVPQGKGGRGGRGGQGQGRGRK